jgi:16S rRNA (cytosine1402-N4)-methyltransferase
MRFRFVAGSFAELPGLLARGGLRACGILLDLGVSSPQLDEAERGFSFQHDGPLDMRMDRSAASRRRIGWRAPAEDEIARSCATTARSATPGASPRPSSASAAAAAADPHGELAAVVSEAHPRWEKHKHPATRSFQAIRIRINRELDDLARSARGGPGSAGYRRTPGGDQFSLPRGSLVKRCCRDMSRGPQLPREIPGAEAGRGQRLRLIGKAVRAGEARWLRNPRARSAIMRCAERVA